MKILISNDDGIQAVGINALIDVLCEEHELYVAAPMSQKSASSHALTMHNPIRVREINDDRTVKSWSIDGNPADCTKLALEELVGFKPDWLISGINHGPNLGTDIFYSGTVAAAAEGTLFGVKSVAISYMNFTQTDFTSPKKATKKALDWIFDHPVGEDILLNVNIPDVEFEEMKGLKITTIGEARYDKPFTRREDPRGNTYYWLAGDLILQSNSEDADVVAVRDGHITITPIKYQFEDQRVLKHMRQCLNESK